MGDGWPRGLGRFFLRGPVHTSFESLTLHRFALGSRKPCPFGQAPSLRFGPAVRRGRDALLLAGKKAVMVAAHR